MNMHDNDQIERISREAATRLAETASYLKKEWHKRSPEQREGIIAGVAIVGLGIIVVGSFIAGQKAVDRFRDFTNKDDK